MLKLRKVELFGFKSFFEKTPITFSGSGITCIVGPNGCGKSNVVDAVTWVLGEQSHKMLRAERMSDCIFNGTAKRPPLGMAQVTLTLVDPELSEAVAKVIDGQEYGQEDAADLSNESGTPAMSMAEASDDSIAVIEADAESADASAFASPEGENLGADFAGAKRKGRKRAEVKASIRLRPGEVVVGRRLYRSGQSEYLINGRVARLRDVQEIFMGIGLGPDSYAIIEQGRIGQVLNSKPMDRRAIIEEAAGITMYKTKRRLAEAKLEASKINLSRVNDIYVEVEKQVASLKRQASKARRYAEIRDQMRGLLRVVLASKAQHLDTEAARLENLLREMDTAEARESHTVQEMGDEQERLTARTYEMEGELRQTHNLLGQTSLDLDRAENRITFNREQAAQLDARIGALAAEIEQAASQTAGLAARIDEQHQSVAALRGQAFELEAALRESSERVSNNVAEQATLENQIAQLRQLAARLVEESARAQAESLQAEEAAARHTAAETHRAEALRAVEEECAALGARATSAEMGFANAENESRRLAAVVREAQSRIGELRQTQQETGAQLERVRRELSGESARKASLERILSERTYTADAVQKLFGASGTGASHFAAAGGFRAVGLLADYAEVQEQYEGAVEQFLREELEYVVVETFDHARAGVALLREEMGGRATFFVDSLRSLKIDMPEADAEMPSAEGVLARLDRLVEFRDPLGPATKYFLSKLRTAYVVESPETAERMARENPHSYFLTADGTCYHGRMVSGGRKNDAGPLALKRELRHHESEVARLEAIVQDQQSALTALGQEIMGAESHLSLATAQHLEAEKALVAATHQRDQARNDFSRVNQQLAAGREEIVRLRQEAEAARERSARLREEHASALRSRSEAETEAADAADKLSMMRSDLQSLQERVVGGREELATMSERLASAEAAERRMAEERALASSRVESLRDQQTALDQQKTEIESSCGQLAQQAGDLRNEKIRLEERKAAFETEWDTARTRAGQIEETLRTQRQSLDELRAERSQRQVEKARNDADRDYLRQTCVAELNAQPEELTLEQQEMLAGEALVGAETSYNEMKARVEAMGPVNMMALEEFREAEERETFLRRERDDLVESIQNTQLTINELDQVSREKFEEAFQFINANFATAFHTLFGGGHGEMRLSEPDSSGESGIDIVAQPPGKKLQNVLLLSGGEKALTALALLIAVFKYQPSPFCILDEVDAPLDEANVGRFNKMLADMCAQTQFIVVTHNRRTMEMGSVLYGVTMQEPGVSKLVSVKWEESDAASATPAAASNAA
ncbi:MAG: chromosome segregation protein SMC [Candidatus Acidiferrales bacterium]